MKTITIEYNNSFVTDLVVRQRIIDADIGAIAIDGDNVCEGCVHCQFPGVRWPASPDGDTTHSYVEKCDYCDRFEDDYDAAAHIAEKLGCMIGIAYRCLWEDAADDAEIGGTYAKPQPPSDAVQSVWMESPSGTSLFLDRPERDGQE